MDKVKKLPMFRGKTALKSGATVTPLFRAVFPQTPKD
jgi:hypothetical protein